MSDGFTQQQIAALQAKLDPAHVAQRQQAGRKLSYIEGWWAISEANRIFGFDKWQRQTVEMRQLGVPYEKDGKQRVAYMAKVMIEVDTGVQTIRREGTGFGSGIAADLNDAHESAFKEAETDAMKRALMTFGNPFGLALYDKTQANVGVEKTKEELIAEVPDAPVTDSWQKPRATLPPPPRKANGLPEVGFRQDGARTAHALKKEQPELWPDLMREIADQQSVVGLERLWPAWKGISERDLWPPEWHQEMVQMFKDRKAEIVAQIEAMDDPERSHLSVEEQFKASVAKLPRLNDDDNPNYLLAGE